MTDERPVSWSERVSGNTLCELRRTSESGSPADTSKASWSAPWKKASLSAASHHTTGQVHVRQSAVYGGNSTQIRFSRLCNMKFAWAYLINRWWLYLPSHSSLLHQTANAASLFVSVASLRCPAVAGREQHVPGLSDGKQFRVLHHVPHGGTGTRWHQNEGGHASRLRAHPQIQLLGKFSPYDSPCPPSTYASLLLHLRQHAAWEGHVSEN